MPREFRKRGKKFKGKNTQDQLEDDPVPYEQPVQHAHPAQEQPVTSDNPFGVVDPDLKAYIRSVDSQLKEWQEDSGFVDGEDDPREGTSALLALFTCYSLLSDRRTFLVAALSEISGKECLVAADPDCAPVVERMIHSMDDFLKRVFMDRLTGS